MGTSRASRSFTPGAPAGGRVNSAGLAMRELAALLDQLDHGDPPKKQARVYARLPFRHASIAVGLTHPGSNATVSITVASRNLSRGGMSVLHGGYVHPRSRCVFSLPLAAGGVRAVAGVVSYCRHVRGMVHELGVRFEEPIRLRDFVVPRVFIETYSFERVDPAALSGSLLYVEDSSLGQKLAAAYLKDTSVRLRAVGSIAAALQSTPHGFDLVIADFHLPDGSGVDLLTRMREQGSATPVVLMTADTSDDTQRKIADAKFDGYLVKPITRERMLRAVAEFLIPGSSAGTPAREAPGPSGAPTGGTVTPAGTPDAIYSTLTPGDPAAPLVEDFAREAPAKAGAMRTALASGDAGECRRVCLELGGFASSCGFESVGRAAARAADALARAKHARECQTDVEQLAALCERVRMRAAA